MGIVCRFWLPTSFLRLTLVLFTLVCSVCISADGRRFLHWRSNRLGVTQTYVHGADPHIPPLLATGVSLLPLAVGGATALVPGLTEINVLPGIDYQVAALVLSGKLSEAAWRWGVPLNHPTAWMAPGFITRRRDDLGADIFDLGVRFSNEDLAIAMHLATQHAGNKIPVLAIRRPNGPTIFLTQPDKMKELLNVASPTAMDQHPLFHALQNPDRYFAVFEFNGADPHLNSIPYYHRWRGNHEIGANPTNLLAHTSELTLPSLPNPEFSIGLMGELLHRYQSADLETADLENIFSDILLSNRYSSSQHAPLRQAVSASLSDPRFRASPAGREHLILTAMLDTDPEVRKNGVEALQTLPPDSQIPISDLIAAAMYGQTNSEFQSTDRSGTRQALIQALQHRSYSFSEDIWLNILAVDPNRRVREEANFALSSSRRNEQRLSHHYRTWQNENHESSPLPSGLDDLDQRFLQGLLADTLENPILPPKDFVSTEKLVVSGIQSHFEMRAREFLRQSGKPSSDLYVVTAQADQLLSRFFRAVPLQVLERLPSYRLSALLQNVTEEDIDWLLANPALSRESRFLQQVVEAKATKIRLRVLDSPIPFTDAAIRIGASIGGMAGIWGAISIAIPLSNSGIDGLMSSAGFILLGVSGGLASGLVTGLPFDLLREPHRIYRVGLEMRQMVSRWVLLPDPQLHTNLQERYMRRSHFNTACGRILDSLLRLFTGKAS